MQYTHLKKVAGPIPLDGQHLERISFPEKGTTNLRDLAQSLSLNAVIVSLT